MIPTRMPPPSDQPIGWSPNSQGTTAAQIVNGIQALTAAELDAFLLGAGSLVQRSLLMPHTVFRSLNTAPQTIVDFSTLNAPATKVITPVWWAVQNATGGTAYSATTILSFRYVGIAVDAVGSTITVSNSANNQNRQTDPCGVAGDNLGNNVFAAGLSLQVRSTADRANGSGFVLVTLGFLLLDEVP